MILDRLCNESSYKSLIIANIKIKNQSEERDNSINDGKQ